MRVLSCLRVSISPPPPGVGCANGRSVCGCGRDGGLLASVLCSCRSLACARSLLSRLRFGFSFPGSPRFSDLLGRVLFVCVGSRPASPRVPRPVRFLLRACFPPRLIRRVRSDRRPCFPVLALAIAWRCRVILSVRSACFAHLGLVRPRVGLALVRPSCCLASFRPSPRLACRRTGRLGVPFLVVARSSVAGRLAPCPPPVFLACFPASVSCGMAVGGGVPRCPCVPLACCLLTRLGSCVGGVGVSCLRVACSRYAYRPVPRIEERSDISRFDCSFSFFPIRR